MKKIIIGILIGYVIAKSMEVDAFDIDNMMHSLNNGVFPWEVG